MIHALLLLLKIIGILLLILFGFFFTLLCLILFVPVRYRGDGSYEKVFDGEICISWLFHLVEARLDYHGHADVRVRILWFRILEHKDGMTEDETDGEEKDGLNGDLTAPPSFEEDHERFTDNDQREIKISSGKEQRALSESQKKVETGSQNGFDCNRTPEEDLYGNEKARHFLRLTRWRERWQRKLSKVFEFPRKLQKFVKKVGKEKESMEKKWNRFLLFLRDEQNQKAFRLIKKRAMCLIRHMLPKKISGRIHFGFEDPYYTGQVLTVVSPFYGIYANRLTIEPDFCKGTLDGEIHASGRFAIGYLLWTFLRLLTSKEIRRLLKFLKRKEKWS